MDGEQTYRTERLGARVPADVKATLQRAADLTGRSLSDFVIASAQAAAEETIRQHAIMELTARDSRLLAEALLNPPEPNARLRTAFEDYDRFTDQRAR
jgi:uncharacterized protein (DUF1778 family)